MKILKLKSFSKWAKRENIADKSLRKAIDEIQKGLVDADLGGSLIKKRIARVGVGKRSGYRTLLAYQENERAVFILGFPKNELDNIKDDKLLAFKKIGRKVLNESDEKIRERLLTGELIEVK